MKLSKTSSAPVVDATEYRGPIGCLWYLVHTRLGITFTVVKHILCYIVGMITYGCHYKHGRKVLKLLGYNDVDMGGDIDTRKSTTSVVFYLGSSPITWQSQKQKVVALSSCEAEYIAGTMVACQGVWLARLLTELKNERCTTFILKMDSQSAIVLSKNPVSHDQSKHIDVRYHFIRDCVGDGRMDIEHVCTEEQITDILTKPLGHDWFCELPEKLGIVEVGKKLKD